MKDRFEHLTGIRDGAMRRHLIADVDINEVLAGITQEIRNNVDRTNHTIGAAEAHELRFERYLLIETALGYLSLAEARDNELDMTTYEAGYYAEDS